MYTAQFYIHPIRKVLWQIRRIAKIPGRFFKNKKLNGLKYFFLFLFVTATCGKIFSQTLYNQQSALDSLKTGLHCVYNFEFEKAESIAADISQRFPNEPSLLMYDALLLYWKYFPLIADTEMGNKYEDLLQQSIAESKKKLKLQTDEQLTIFFDMMPRLMLLQFYADNGQGIKSIPHLTHLYQALKEGFTFCTTMPEYYFTTGLYNYYIEAYPEANPFYKPFVFFFPDGDKSLGLQQLYQCWQQSKLTGAEALTFLTYININFETNYQEGTKYAWELAINYPNNPLFTEYYVQLLLLSKQYNKAEEVVKNFKENHKMNTFFNNVFLVLESITLEKYHNNYAKAEQKYQTVINDLEPYGSYANRYRSYAFFGLSRIYKIKGMYSEAAHYRSLALKFSQYPKVNFD